MTAMRPNILFIFSDDHNVGGISAYEENRWQTPNIDRIADEGMRFDRTFCANSICTPSRATVFSGTHSHKNGVLQLAPWYAFDPARGAVQELLQQAGYQTGFFGKWHMASEPTGFDEWEAMTADCGQGTYYNPHFIRSAVREPVHHQGYAADIVTDLSIDWLERRDPDEPFILFSHHKSPHGPWLPRLDRYGDHYDDLAISEPATMAEDFTGRGEGTPSKDSANSLLTTTDKHHLMLTPPDDLDDETLATWKSVYEQENQDYLTRREAGTLSRAEDIRWRFQRLARNYYLTVASLDDAIGRLLDYLDDAGLRENTVVIYASDQGFYVGDFGWYDKRYIYEISMRMPFLVRWPGVTAPGTVNADLTQNIDFAQTFLEIAGLDAPPAMQGRSLVPLLQGETPANWREALYYQYYGNSWRLPSHYGVRTETHKLVRFFYGVREFWELYDLVSDPDELVNLYEDPRCAAVRQELHAMLEQLRKDYEVPESDEEIIASSCRVETPVFS